MSALTLLLLLVGLSIAGSVVGCALVLMVAERQGRKDKVHHDKHGMDR